MCMYDSQDLLLLQPVVRLLSPYRAIRDIFGKPAPFCDLSCSKGKSARASFRAPRLVNRFGGVRNLRAGKVLVEEA